jgi:cytochrome P450
MIAPHNDDLFPYLRWAREHDPVTFHAVLGACLVTRYDTIRAIAADPQQFSSRYSVPTPIDLQPPEFAEILSVVGDATAVAIGLDGQELAEVRAIWQRLPPARPTWTASLPRFSDTRTSLMAGL